MDERHHKQMASHLGVTGGTTDGQHDDSNTRGESITDGQPMTLV